MILLIGPGALGTLLSVRLHDGGAEVALLDRDPERAARLSLSGITVDGLDGASRTMKVPVSADPSAFAPELVIVCVKAPATVGAASAIRALRGAATVLVLQNGLGRAQEVGELIGDPSRVLGGATSEGATLIAPGHARHAGRGAFRIAALVPEAGPRADAAAALLRGAGMTVEVVPDLRRLEWEKLVVNAAINALTGLLGRENGALLRSGAARALAQSAAEEAGDVAVALGVPGDWSAEAVRARWEGVAAATSANHSSTLQDLRRGQSTEVRAINGAVARAAQSLGLSAPVNAALDAMIRAVEELR